MRGRHLVLRATVSIGLLVGLAWWLDLGTVMSRLGRMRPGWVMLAGCDLGRAGGRAGVALAVHRRVPGC